MYDSAKVAAPRAPALLSATCPAPLTMTSQPCTFPASLAPQEFCTSTRSPTCITMVVVAVVEGEVVVAHCYHQEPSAGKGTKAGSLEHTECVCV